MKLKFLLHDEVQQERRAYLRELVTCFSIGILLAVGMIVWLSFSDTPTDSHGRMLQQLNLRGAEFLGIVSVGGWFFALALLLGMGKWDT